MAIPARLTNWVRAPKNGRATQRLAMIAANREVRGASARAALITNAEIARPAKNIMVPNAPIVPRLR